MNKKLIAATGVALTGAVLLAGCVQKQPETETAAGNVLTVSSTADACEVSTATATSGPDQDARPRDPSSQNITDRLDSAESEAKIMKLVSADRAVSCALAGIGWPACTAAARHSPYSACRNATP